MLHTFSLSCYPYYVPCKFVDVDIYCITVNCILAVNTIIMLNQ